MIIPTKKKIMLLSLLLPFLAVQGQEQKNWPIDSIGKYLEFRYTPPQRFVQTFGEIIFPTKEFPRVPRNHDAQWTSADSQCIVFLEDGGISGSLASGFRSKIDKSRTGINNSTYNLISLYLRITTLGQGLPVDKKEELWSTIEIWPEQKAKEWFNAQHVIEYPNAGYKDAIYQDKYHLKRSLCIIKWEQSVYINFLVTEEGYDNIDKYMEEFEKVFWYNN